MKYRALIEQDEDGIYVAEVPSLSGCISHGQTRRSRREHQGSYRSVPRKPEGARRPYSATDHRRVGRGSCVSAMPGVSGREVVKALL